MIATIKDVLAIIRQMYDEPKNAIKPDTNFTFLDGADPLTVIEIVIELECKYGVTISDEALEHLNLNTAERLVTHINRQLSEIPK